MEHRSPALAIAGGANNLAFVVDSAPEISASCARGGAFCFSPLVVTACALCFGSEEACPNCTMTQKRMVELTIPPTIVQSWECRFFLGAVLATSPRPPRPKYSPTP